MNSINSSGCFWVLPNMSEFQWLLINYCNLHLQWHNETALMLAAQGGHTEIVKALIESWC